MTYTEDDLVEQPAIDLFAHMGWNTAVCWEETFGDKGEALGEPLGRNTRDDVVLFTRLRIALVSLNPGLESRIIQEAIDEMTRDRSAMSDMAANEEVYKLLKDGYSYISNEDGEEDATVRYVDWNDPSKNDFLLCSQMTIAGEIDNRRPDLLGFVNGLPLVFIELKTSHKQLINGYKDNYKDYRHTIPQLFVYNQLVIISNGIQSRVGTISSTWEHFAEWKKVESEKEARKVSLEVVIRGVCEKNRLLDIMENFILFVDMKETVKIVAKYHQYLGVNQALKGLDEVDDKAEAAQLLKGQLGVFWHTQGSGKSFSMVFFTKKAFRKYSGNWTFVIVTDRTDLDDQIYKTFHNSGMLNKRCQAESGAELKEFLSDDNRFVFTLIQKFQGDEQGNYPMLSDRDDIIVITDEAHRSQYDSLAMNMRKAMPNASFMAFTGTPLLNGEEKTREVFGDYISIYNFADAVDDGATLPLYYENRVPEVNLLVDDLGEQIADIIDDADLNEDQEARLESEFAKQYHIITREDRLAGIAEDLVDHYINREPFHDGKLGKAMVISIDKATAIRMYDQVQIAWKKKLDKLQTLAKHLSGSHLARIQFQIEHMKETDMAVVVSGGQNDEVNLAKKGIDYRTHRERFVKEAIDEKFKDPADNLRIVFVCAMWLTGFDAPAVSTLYIDKPLKSHTLMQTIARANRVYPGKPAGQVVDYINIFGALQSALGMYGGGESDSYVDSPAIDKEELINGLKAALVDLNVFLEERKVDLQAIINAPTTDFTKLTLLDEASEILLEPANQDEFTSFVRQINRIFKSILPDDRAMEFMPQRIAINVIYQQMRKKSGISIDDEDVLDVIRNQVNELLDESIATIEIKDNLPEPINIAGVDFDALAEMVAQIQQPKISDAERLKNILDRKIAKMMELNRSRIDLQEKFQEIVEQYNLGAHSAEQFFEELEALIKDLDEEDHRAVKEGLSEEELAIFDLLSSKVTLTTKERNQVKAIAKELIDKIKEALVLDWRKRQRTKARMQNLIEEVLDELPEAYGDDLWANTCSEVFHHIYEKYPAENANVYTH